MNSNRRRLLCCCLCSLLFFGGCTTPLQKKYSDESVRVYAELLVLHEREKVFGNTPDSLYRLKVKDLLAARKIDEENYRRRIEELSRDDAEWREFLGRATAVMDSLKVARKEFE